VLALVKKLADFLEGVKGLSILVGILLVVLNFIAQYIPGPTFLGDSNLLLHLGVVVGLLGLLLAEAL
jgi:hypothetical protein